MIFSSTLFLKLLVYVVTAAAPAESATSRECIEKDGKTVWVNTEFGKVWLGDLEHVDLLFY